ncbi:hypothetical protein LTR78_006152 [Recurvomyces mirabilis]|uniref:Uncharacterized protein n=1 Tax=Recurvomyces mirabilis TaxID=574656 RepID=A0AAE0WLK8_9PEZI|nr:hypothetical protein LTR78_006152 [Recurvomyces mirabilis]KAK5151994.1 hypothetical protein LTS14_008768 [Recurvomyces mirabilis]
MAKKSAVKTPKTPARHADDYSESSEEDEVDDTMVHSPQIQHLASDLPDPSSPEKDVPRPSARVEIRRSSTRATMGANQSREETDQSAQAVTIEHQAQRSPRKSTGKLKRPSAPFNPLGSRRSTTQAATAQRRIGGEKQVRPDEYDFNPSPLRATLRLPRKDLKSLREFSPTKKQKQAAVKAARVPTREESYEATQRQVDATVFGAERDADEGLSSPRRSRRQAEASWTPAEAVVQEAEELDGEAEEYAQQMQHLQDSMHNQIDGIAHEIEDNPTAKPQPRRSPRKPATASQLDVTTLRPKKNRTSAGSRLSTAADEDGESASTSRAARIAEENRQEREARRARKQKLDERAETRKQEAEDKASSRPPDPRSIEKPGRPRKARDSEAARKEAEDASLLSLGEQGEGVVADDEGDADAGGEDEDDDDNDLLAPTTVRKVRSAPRVVIDKARPSELFGRSTTANDLAASSPEKSPQKRKREWVQSQGSASAANTSAKRQKQTLADTASGSASMRYGEGDEPEAKGAQAPGRRLYGMWRALKIVRNAVAEIGVWVREGEPQPARTIKLRDHAVKAVFDLCDEYLEDDLTQPEAEVNVDDLSDQVRALYTTVHGEAPDLENEVRCKNIYANLFPQLVKLLWRMVKDYEKADAGSRESLTLERLRDIRNFIRMTINLGIGAKDFKARPGTHLSIVQPVDSIVAKLKPIDKALTLQLVRREREEITLIRSQRAAEDRALAAQRAAVEARQEERVKTARRKWKQLHIERLCAEGGIVPRQKRQHLRMPEPRVEYDQDGAPFTREAVFCPRIGPPPADVEKARMLVWSNVHLAALAEGLARYAGADVYEKIFRQYCPRGGCLNGYNVTEILVCAAGLKEYLVGLAEEAGKEVEGWIGGIPVWTKGYPLGKENEEDGGGDVAAGAGRWGEGLEVVDEEDDQGDEL